MTNKGEVRSEVGNFDENVFRSEVDVKLRSSFSLMTSYSSRFFLHKHNQCSLSY